MIHVLYNFLLQAESPAAATVGPGFKGIAGTSDQPIFWNNVYPRFFLSEVNLIAFLLDL